MPGHFLRPHLGKYAAAQGLAVLKGDASGNWEVLKRPRWQFCLARRLEIENL